MNNIVYFNGEYVPEERALIPVEERGFNFGDSLYEVSRIYGGVPFTLAEHFARLARGARIIKLKLDFTLDDLDRIIRRLVDLNGLPDSFAYFQFSRGSAPRGHAFPTESKTNFLVILKPFHAITLEERYQGVLAITHPDLRHQLCDVKTTNLIANVLAKQAAVEAGAYEAILVRGRFVTEGSATSVYMVKDGVLHTHPLGNILPGITRSVIVDMCREQGVRLQEEPFTPAEMFAADEVFITGSTLEIMPVVEIDGQTIGTGKVGPLTKELIHYYIKRVEGECGQYWV